MIVHAYAQPATTFLSATLNHRLARACFHTGTKAMHTDATTYFRLISSLRHALLPISSYMISELPRDYTVLEDAGQSHEGGSRNFQREHGSGLP